MPRDLLTTLAVNPTFDGVLASLTGLSYDQISPDQLDDLAWAPFFQWRLALEPELLVQNRGDAFLSLYDVDIPASAGYALQRMESPAYTVQPVPVVRSVQITRENAQTYAWVAASLIENGVVLQDATIQWRWVNGSWRRLN